MGEILIRSIFLAIALAMDAFAVSLSNGLKEPNMSKIKVIAICFSFGFFQLLMPFIGYLCGHAIIKYIVKFIPYIALILLLFLGIKMIIEGIKKNDKEEKEIRNITFTMVLLQSIATSIDALSTGLTFSNYTINQALICVSIIGIITFIICIFGFYLGKKTGVLFANKADIIGGVILIIIGLDIFLKGIIG